MSDTIMTDLTPSRNETLDALAMKVIGEPREQNRWGKLMLIDYLKANPEVRYLYSLLPYGGTTITVADDDYVHFKLSQPGGQK